MASPPPKYLLQALGVVGLCSLVGAAYAAFNFIDGCRPLGNHLRLILSGACVGSFAGCIFAFDADSDLHVADRPLLRGVAGALCGLALGCIWHWGREGFILATVIGTGLGLLGMIWARILHHI